MKNLLLLFLFLPLFASAQTVPNGNFESWFLVGDNENPDFWITDNTELQPTVTKDFDSYEGEIAMRVTGQPMGVGDYGEAYTLFETEAIPAALNFYAKTDVAFGGVSVEITFLNQELEVYTEIWSNTENLVDYTLVSMALDQIEPVITHARIKVVAQVGDLVPGHAWISVDAMAFGEPLKVDKPIPGSFKIFPNPAKENITIKSIDGSLGNLTITDALGKIVLEKQVQENETSIDVEGFAPGVYLLISEDGYMKSSTFIVN